MWGQVSKAERDRTKLRIIPTRVGTRIKIPACRATDRDHPHACGDKIKSISMGFITIGSSPRVWGQGKSFKNFIPRRRIIPTRVGTSVVNPICKHIFEDHPHACGDKINHLLSSYLCLGSSPRVWGQVWFYCLNVLRPRIIPTRVGTRRTTSTL